MKVDRLTEDSIRSLVHAFYEKVRRDEQLAAIFTEAVGDDWNLHISRMCSFWSTAMRISRRYRGDMLLAHRRLLPRLRPELFQRWLALFEQTVDERFAPETAAALRDRARKTARNLQLALFHPASGAAQVAPLAGAGRSAGK
jgi:hemoglobin